MQLFVFIALIAITAFSTSVNAARLEIDQHASIVLHIGAAFLLYSHIGGGVVGLIAGAVAGLAKKGGKAHRLAGKLFFYAMFICYLLAAVIPPKNN